MSYFSVACFSRCAESVNHCMLAVESEPPLYSGTRWSMAYPGHAPELLPVDGQGLDFLKSDFTWTLLAIRPFESRAHPMHRIVDLLGLICAATVERCVAAGWLDAACTGTVAARFDVADDAGAWCVEVA